MFTINRTMIASASAAIALSVACVALAQEAPPSVSGPDNYIFVHPGNVEKVIERGAPEHRPAPMPRWDGDKPFISDLHAPQFPVPQFPAEMLDGFRPAAMTAFNLFDVAVQELSPITVGEETLIALRLPEGQRIVRLRPHSLREPGARLAVDVGGGLLVDHAWPAITTYRGGVDGALDYDVAASIIDGQVSMLILPRKPGLPSLHIQPMRDAVPGLPGSLHVMYRNVDCISSGHHCGVNADDLPLFPAQPAPATPLWSNPMLIVTASRPMEKLARQPDETGGGGIAGDDGSIAVANIRCQIGLDADFEFYQANGSSVTNTIYDMDLIMNQVGLIYQNQVEIAYTETFILVRTSAADPYNATNSSTILCEFGDWWNANVSATRDVAHLFTGKDMDGNTVGLAWPGVICNVNLNTNPPCAGGSKGYSLAQSRFSATMANRVQDTAHELGHNWSACHCDQSSCTGGAADADCGIMNSFVDIGSSNFEVRGRNAIRAHRDSRGCLDVWQNPTYVNWAYVGTETGSISQPWNTIFEGLDACLVFGTLNVQAGNYLQNPNIFKSKTINAIGGTVRIGN